MNKLVRLIPLGWASLTTRSLNTEAKSHIYLEKVIKRVILEFKNNDRIFLTDDIKNVFKQFYQVKHININLSDQKLSLLGEKNKFDLCVLNISELKTAVDLKRSSIKSLILINDNNFDFSHLLKVAVQTSPNLIIDNKFVYKYEPILNTLKPVEHFESQPDQNYPIMNSIISKNVKTLLQECF